MQGTLLFSVDFDEKEMKILTETLSLGEITPDTIKVVLGRLAKGLACAEEKPDAAQDTAKPKKKKEKRKYNLSPEGREALRANTEKARLAHMAAAAERHAANPKPAADPKRSAAMKAAWEKRKRLAVQAQVTAELEAKKATFVKDAKAALRDRNREYRRAYALKLEKGDPDAARLELLNRGRKAYEAREKDPTIALNDDDLHAIAVYRKAMEVKDGQ